MSNTDRLLHDAQRFMREAAIDRDARSTVTAVATWPELVEAVQTLVSTQTRGRDPAVVSTMGMVGAIASSMHRDQLTSGWPTSGATNEQFLGAAERVHQAASILEKTPEPHSAATARRGLEVLYEGAHLIRTGMEEYLAHQLAHQQGRDIHRAVPMMDRVHRSEQLLDAAVNPWPWTGPSPTDLGPTQQLAQTLSRWDITAHRALVVTSTAAVQMVADGQALATRSAGVVLMAAHALDTGPTAGRDSTRLTEAIGDSARRWQELARTAEKSSFASPADRAAQEAFRSLREDLGRVLFDAPRPTAPKDIAERIDLNAASRLAHQFLVASADLAKSTEAAVGNPGLHGSTRALLHQQRQVQGDEVTLSSPSQGLSGKTMPIPSKMRKPLRASSADVTVATERVASLAIVAHQPGSSSAVTARGTRLRPEHLLGPSRPIRSQGPERTP